MRDWYRYLTTVTIFNAWDTAAHALNGLDKDSDSCLLTDNPILVENTREDPRHPMYPAAGRKKGEWHKRI